MPAAQQRGKLNIGVIGPGSYSFTWWSWSDIIEGTMSGSPRGNFATQLLNMDITHVWDRHTKADDEFARRMDVTLLKRIGDMIGKTDDL